MGKRILNVLFSSNFSWRTSIIFAGPLVPLLRTSGDNVLGYPYLSASPPVRNVIVRSISGATPADLLMASMVAETYWPLRPGSFPSGMCPGKSHKTMMIYYLVALDCNFSLFCASFE